MKEIWKDIPGYENLYQASNYGNIRNKYKIMKPKISNRGYLRISLSKNGISKTYSVHRLIALTFLNNNHNYSVINHKDNNKLNNNVNNLEWCTQSHNIKEAYKLGTEKPTKGCFKKGTIPHNRKKINQYDLEGNFIKTWNSITKASIFFSNSKHSSIQLCLLGKCKTAYGYKWEYAD